ncbi:LOB domain-containing protein 29 [Brachypodium distachyon]|uniref:LOB domain-containing protein n=1 Tax=Brachypodium distachyon TaxID=15368 RepID=I1H9Q0_BRADI|nr:LOB domain-containing protein 29 [Brachypodium distachyon]KQK23639.1 hypothetical protein BRADI_1g75120v3 [Brachypodium distachyon]|eukprot:XP_003558806.1 LOB domain-containing protein 29 [Brachypodium distachyon]
MASTATTTGSPCGACKFLRRKCAAECVFAPYFCAEDGASQFAAIHRVFGASNAAKLLSGVPPADRSEAAATVTYEAQARVRDPVYGCVAHIFALQQQVAALQVQVAHARTQAMAAAAAAGGHLLLQQQQGQGWQMGAEHDQSTQSSGCYGGSDGSTSLQQHAAEVYCFGEQEEGSYSR